MALKLLLLRHADAQPRKGAMEDADRPLSALGREQAQRVASHLLKTDFIPGRVLLSDAMRVQETWRILQNICGYSIEGESRSDLYLAGAGTLIHLLMRQDPVLTSPTLVIGHNPGLSLLALALAGGHGAAEDNAMLSAGLPPGGSALLTSATESWAELQPGSAQLIECWHP